MTSSGLTGRSHPQFGQVSGRNLLSFDEMVKLDIHYIENWSVLVDVRILFKTVWVMFFGRAY